MARKPDKIVTLAGDAFLADVRVENLNVEVTRTNTGISVMIRDVKDRMRRQRFTMRYNEPPDFKINDEDVGEWMKWMERTDKYRTLDPLLAWMRHHDEPACDDNVTQLHLDPLMPAKVLAAANKAAEQRQARQLTRSNPVDMKVDFPVTAVTYEVITGHHPEQDDLERCNCKKAGELGHWSCGMCRHGWPVFMCEHCFSHSPDLEGRQVHPEETSHGTG